MEKKFKTKNQHYVPQFYLRNFSEDGCGIRTLNLATSKIIPHAKLKNQCSKAYFYGENGILETALGEMKTSFSQAFKKCIFLNSPKYRISDETFYFLSMFAAIQYMRTKNYMDIAKHFGQELYGTVAEFYIKANNLDVSPNQYSIETESFFSSFILKIGILNQPLLNDLECVILNNETTEDFVLSDNPVVFQNPFIEKFLKHSFSGMASKGLQIYFPISPKKIICFYDSDVYKFNGRNIIDIKSPKDIESINQLQFINADKNVYFEKENFNTEKYLSFRKKQLELQAAPIGKYINPQEPNEFSIRISPSPNIDFKLSIFSIKPTMLRKAFHSSCNLQDWIRNKKSFC